MLSRSNRPTTRRLHVFLCHSSADKPIVREVNLKLQAEGWIDPWLDEEKILPGRDWNAEISAAVDKSEAVIVFLSKGSVAKEGYIQREFRSILQEALEKPEQTVFILPLRIDECVIPSSVRKIQYIDYFPKNKKKAAYERLLQSLGERARSLGINVKKTSKKAASYSIAVGPGGRKKRGTDSKFELKIIDSQRISESLSTPGGHYVYSYGDLQFVQVPAGPFVMGSNRFGNPLSYPDERPQLKVAIPYDYFIGRFPVTIAQYLTFVEWRGLDHEWEDNLESIFEHPVTCVTWDRARDYCKWLNEQYAAELPARSGVKPVFRLPSEAEWEKAARGEKGFEWPWGNKFDASKCNSREAGILTTTPVGKYSSRGGDSPYGAADLVGNVWEWTNTLYARYPYRSSDGRERNQGQGLKCVVRGGCFRDNAQYVRSAYRYMIPNSSLYYFQGFRVVIAPPVSRII